MGNAVLTFPFSFDRTCSDLQKRGGKMNADAWKRGKKFNKKRSLDNLVSG